jgi:hypothetical protein
VKLHLTIANLPQKVRVVLKLSFHETSQKTNYNIGRYLLMKRLCYWIQSVTCRVVKPTTTIDDLGPFLMTLNLEV